MKTSIQNIIEPRVRDLGGFEVMRVLPAASQRTVGPFIFWDQIGPATFDPGNGIDVRPHPHIGLATVTYLFEGEMDHRDSLGCVQTIKPGDVNWMTAGRGIVHSERTGPDARARGSALYGIQSWVALPAGDEETSPGFHHHPAATLPEVSIGNARLRVIAGRAFGETSPVKTCSDTLYVDAIFTGDTSLELAADHEERGVYALEGSIRVAGEDLPPGRLAVLAPEVPVTVETVGAAHAMLLGGARLDGQRHIWWNFVSSSRERIDRAKADWAEGRFDAVPGETELIPLPQRL